MTLRSVDDHREHRGLSGVSFLSQPTLVTDSDYAIDRTGTAAREAPATRRDTVVTAPLP